MTMMAFVDGERVFSSLTSARDKDTEKAWLDIAANALWPKLNGKG